MESKTMKTRISAAAVVLAMLLSLIPMTVLADDAYGMQGDNTNKNVKLQMVEPSDITVNSATTGDYDNTINTPVEVDNGVAVFKFKTSVAGGQYENVATGVQNTTFTDENGQAVSGVSATAQDIDSANLSFTMNVSGLQEGSSYVMTIPSSFSVGGGNWTLQATVKFHFTTAAPAKGTEANPYVRSDKTADGSDTNCLVLMFCDAEGNIIKSAEKYNVQANALQVTYSEGLSDPIYLKAFYKDGSELNANDWIHAQTPTGQDITCQSKKIVVLNSKTTSSFCVNDQVVTKTSPIWVDLDSVIKITTNGPVKVGSHLLRFCLGDPDYESAEVNGKVSNHVHFGAAFNIKALSDGTTPVNKIGIDETTIADISDQSYTGEAIEPELTITYNDATLVKDTDYTVAFENNTEVGTATATITGIGDYDWYTTKTFNIVEAEEPAGPMSAELTSSEGTELKARTKTTLKVENMQNGNLEDYLYKFIVYNETSKQWYKLQDYSDASAFDWYTGPAGVKKLYVDIKNKADETDITRIELSPVNVADNSAKVTLTSEKGDVLDAKTKTTLTATVVEGGESPFTYKFIVHNNDTDEWYRLQDFGESNVCEWYTANAASKTLYVDVKYANGTVVRQALDVTVK